MASNNISFDQIPSSIRKPGKYFEFNTRLAVNTLPANRQKVLLVGQRTSLALETSEKFYGSGLNDLTPAGTFTGLADRRFVVEIDSAGATDSFKWSKDGGLTWDATAVAATGSAQALAEGVTVTLAATTGHTLADRWVFDAYREPTVPEAVPTELFSDAEAATYFGHGSQLHLMAKACLAANAYCSLHACALDDASASVEAAGSITIDGAAAYNGVLTVWIGNQSVDVEVAAADTAATVAQAIVDQIWQQNGLPVRAKVDTAAAGKVNITAKNAGTVGNQIDLDWEVTNEAVSCTISAMASGSGDPDIDDALAEVVPDQYEIICTSLNDATSLEALCDHLDLVSGPMEQRPAIGVAGYDGALASAATLATGVNNGRLLLACLRGSRSISFEIAAAMAAMLAFEEDPARPLNTLELEGIHAPAIEGRFSRTEQESLLYNGVTPLEVGPGNAVQIVRAISTYVKDPQGVDDISLLDITTIRTLDYVRKACRERVALRFPREKLSAKTPAKVRSELLDVLYKLEALEIVENVDEHSDGLIVERDLQDPNRLDAKIPTDVVNGLHVFAGRIDLLL